MQILRTTSRSISQDQFYNRQIKKNYQIHARMIHYIHSQKANLLEQTNKINQVVQKVKKAKSSSKLFKQKQFQQNIKKQNKHLLQKLYNMQPTMKVSKSENKIKPITVSNWHSKKNTQEQIKEQNSRLKKRVDILSSANQKQYRKKIQENIKQYLSLKNHVRKLKQAPNSGKKLNSQKIKQKPKEKLQLQSLTDRNHTNATTGNNVSDKIKDIAKQQQNKEAIQNQQDTNRHTNHHQKQHAPDKLQIENQK